MRIWNAETGAIFHTLEVPDQGGLSFQNSIGFLAFSSDGVLAYVTASSEKINLGDAAIEFDDFLIFVNAFHKG